MARGRWPDSTPDPVMPEPSPIVTQRLKHIEEWKQQKARAERRRSLLATAIMVLGAIMSSVGIGYAAGLGWGIGVFGLYVFVIGVLVGMSEVGPE